MMKNENTTSESGLKRRLGLFSATLVGVGVILGAGIYVLVGVAANQAGNIVWLSFIIAAVVAGFTALSYARLGKLRAKNAPEFQYLSMAFGRTPAFLAGWLVLWATVISSSAVALGFGGYMEHLFGFPQYLSAIGLVVVSSIIVFLGVGESALLAIILTLVEAGGLVIVIAIGIPSFGNVDLFEMASGVSGVIGAASLVFFAYLGFEGMANLSEEMKQPERDLPKAMLLAVGISTLFYILVSIAGVSVLGWQELGRSGAPLAAIASKVLGSKADILLAYIALASTANTVLLLLFAASRAMWAMACAGVLPWRLCVLGKGRKTPWLAIVVVGGCAAVFVLLRNIEDVANFTNFAVLLAFAGVNAAALKLFARNTGVSRVRRVLLNITLPVLGIGSSLWLAVSAGWRAAVFGGGLLVVGILVYLIMKRFMK
jgi:APA family basic amino acid/polyamine antiporter